MGSQRTSSRFMRRGLIPAAILALMAGCALAPTRAGPSIQLYAIDCGRMATNGIDAVDPCFLIRHPEGDLIWDVGLPQTMADAPDGVTNIGATKITMTAKLTDLLAELELKPADIEYLSVSHTHFDHIGNGGLFAASTWIVDADERASAFGPAARGARTFAAYSALENAPTRVIEGGEDHDVFGDGTVTIVQTPGHTPGHTVLLVRLPEAGPVLLAGDVWNTAESRTARKGTAEEIASMDKVERLAAATRARVVRQHVLEDFEALPRFPDFLR